MLNGKVAVVTGASRGIGRQIAISMAKEGAVVIVNYNGSAAKAEDVVKEITEAGGQAEAVQCNVSDYSAAEVFLKDIISRYKRIDILVNNAGITRDNLLMKMSEEEFDAVIDTNLKGAFNCIKHVSRQMLKQKGGRIINISSVSGVMGNAGQANYKHVSRQMLKQKGGRIINISSVSGVMGNAGQANYCASKAGVIGLTKSVAREIGSRGITVNAIAPGFIDTEMTAVLPDDVKKAMGEQIPLKRFGTTEDVAQAAVFLASDRAAYITGQVLCVDGGMAM